MSDRPVPWFCASSDLERWLLLAQDIPGLTVRSVLNPSAGDPGALTLVAQVSRKPYSGYVVADNRAFDLVGPQEALGVFNLDSMTQFGERTQLSLFGALDGTNVFGQLSEEFFVGASGLKFRIYAGLGESTPSGQLKTIGYHGGTDVFGFQFAYPLVRSRAQSLVMAASFDALENNVDNNLGQNGSTQRASYDSLRVLRLGETYALLDTVLGADRTGVNTFNARLSQGLSSLGASANGDTYTPPPRIGEVITFTKANGDLSRTQTLFKPFDDATVALVGRLGWQYSNVLLPPAEKYYLGGPQFNRGYYFGQVSGDSAVAATAELQLNTPFPLPKPIPFQLNSQFYAFYDWGEAWQNTRLEADVVLRTELDFEGVYRVNRYPNGQGPDVSPLSSAAFYWQILQRF
jgi:hemolysin activation/secretion protein